MEIKMKTGINPEDLGLERDELEELTGKWIAIIRSKEKTGDPEIVKQDGRIVASTNLIRVQNIVDDLYPELSNKNKNGKLISYKFIPYKLYSS